jgi:hypothetical protein
MSTIEALLSLRYTVSMYDVCYRQSDQLSGTEVLQSRPVEEREKVKDHGEKGAKSSCAICTHQILLEL